MKRQGVCPLAIGFLGVLFLAGCPDSRPVAPGDKSSKKKSDGASVEVKSDGKGAAASEDMVKFASGSFRLGSIDFEDERSGQVIVLSEYSLDTREVSNGDYRRFLEDLKKNGLPKSYPKIVLKKFPGGKDHSPRHWGTKAYSAVSPTDRSPVVWVDWFDAVAYAAWAGKRLPTECEWERAAGWNSKTRRKRLYPWGDRAPDAKGVYLANFKPLLGAGLDGYEGLASVDSFAQGATPEGLLNMGGNVAEWCSDWYFPSYKNHGDSDPQGPSDGVDRVVRGGSYLTGASSLRVTHRLSADPMLRQPFLGFRCAK